MKRFFNARTSVLRQPLPTGRYRYVRRRWRLLFTIVDGVGELLAAWKSRLARLRVPAERSVEPVRSILLVQLDHLGDALLTAAVLPDLRRRFPKSRIEVLGTPWNREVFEAAPEVDRVHLSKWNRFAGGWRPGWLLATLAWGWRLRGRFDVAIDVRGEFPQAALVWLSGARRRVGWDCGGGGFLLTDHAEFVPGRPEIESRLTLLALLGVQPGRRLLQKRPWFDPGDDARSRMIHRLREVDEHRRLLIVLHIGGGSQAKRWPAAHWQELLGRITAEYDAAIVLVGSRSERHRARAITAGHPWPGVTDWTGQLSLRETAALTERADVLIGPDSGPAHLAAAIGAAAIVLFSGTNRVRQWRPWGRRVAVVRNHTICSPCHRRACPLADHPCMNGLTPEAVMRQLRRALASSVVADAGAPLTRAIAGLHADLPQPARMIHLPTLTRSASEDRQ